MLVCRSAFPWCAGKCLTWLARTASRLTVEQAHVHAMDASSTSHSMHHVGKKISPGGARSPISVPDGGQLCW